MSSTARLILDTLDKMSTPIQDAKKMPALVQPRAEKRKLIEEELNCSLKSPQRRRVRLGSGALSLAGPPLRKSYAPVSLSNGLSSPLTTSIRNTPSPQPSPVPLLRLLHLSLPLLSPPLSLNLKLWTVVAHQCPDQVPSPSLGTVAPCLPDPPAISLSTPLPITTLPVFNLAAPLPVMNGVGRADDGKEKATKLAENKEENNNKKNNKRPLEEETA